jgi:hypothetical protein
MNQLLLAPTDVLFFRDGRPMGGSLSGHGAAWPLPTVTNAALHAALWRSGLADTAHAHSRKSGPQQISSRTELFGSLTSAGPFPVCTNGKAPTWFFQLRPMPAARPNSIRRRNQPAKALLPLRLPLPPLFRAPPPPIPCRS